MQMYPKSTIMGWFFIILGCLLLFFAFDIIVKLLFIIAGIGCILYGCSLKGSNTRFFIQRLFMRFF
jgi:hypothetical protein